MAEDLPPPEALNTTELLQILRSRGLPRVSRTVPKERLVYMVRHYTRPEKEELSQSNESRAKLEKWITKHWQYVNSQLPCKGENRGKCTIYDCSEGRHSECFLGAEEAVTLEQGGLK